MDMKWIATAALTASLAAPAGFTIAAHAAPAPAAFGQYQDGQYQNQDPNWQQPPDDYRDAQRQGFHEGIEAAQRDWNDRRHRDADDHEMYRHPPVDREFVRDFRDGFRHGYSEAMHHMRDGYRRHHDDDEHPY